MKNTQILSKRAGVHILLLALMLSFSASSLFAKTTNDFCPIQANTSIQAVSCFGGSNGQVALNPSGGVAPYTYQWSNGQSSATATNLSEGVYSFTITDQNGCSLNSVAYVAQATNIQANVSRTNNDCYADQNGSLSLSPSGGTAPYTFQWSNGAITASINNLSTGAYAYTITDAAGCSKSGGVSVLSNSGPVIGQISNINNLDCYGDDNGSANLTASGGTAPYTYQWSNGATTASINNLTRGTYFYTITDANGCTGNGKFSIQEPAPVWTSFTYKYACFGENNGSISVNANGGTPPYTYQWSNGATTANLNNLAAGMYFYTVTDANGCQSPEGLVCIFNSSYELNTTASTTNCANGADGSASLITSGGVPPFSYQWSNGATTASITGLAVGEYAYTVTDAGNCPIMGSVTIGSANTAVVASVNVVNNNLRGSAIGGTAPYTYQWSNGQTTQIANAYDNGDAYSLTVTDANGCMGVISGTAQLEEDPCAGNLTYPGLIGNDQYLCAAGNTPAPITSLAPASGGDASSPIQYLWMKSTVSGIFDASTFHPIPNSTSASYAPGPLDETTYFIRCVRRAGCVYIESNTVTITVGDEIDASILRPSLGCFGQTQNYSIANLPDGAEVNWNFSGAVSTSNTNEAEVAVTFNGGGYLDIELTISTATCTATYHDQVTIASDCFVDPNQQLTQNNSNSALAYPNPLANRTQITLAKANDQATPIAVYAVDQTLIATYIIAPGQQHYELDLAGLPTGLYYVNIQHANAPQEVLKLLKN